MYTQSQSVLRRCMIVLAPFTLAAMACSVATEPNLLDTTTSAAQGCPVEDPYCGTDETVNCYIDKDGDGVGTGSAKPYLGECPAGYAYETGDCNDSDATATKTLTCFPDKDKDGLGKSTASPTYYCAKTCPSGYAPNNKDCNDNNASVGSAKLACYTDNDGDGKGGTLNYQCGTTCPAPYVANHDDCGSATYCFERYGTLDLVVDSFSMTLTSNEGGSSPVYASGTASELSTSKAVGNVAKDGTLSFKAADFNIVYSYTQHVHYEKAGVVIYDGDVVVTTTLTANKDIASKIDPATGSITGLTSDIKMTLSVTPVGHSSIVCGESSMPITFSTTSPYSSSKGTLALKSTSFAVDSVSGDGLCAAVNAVAGLPGSAEVSFSATAKSPQPISSWPKI